MAENETNKAKHMYFKMPSQSEIFDDSQLREWAEEIWKDFVGTQISKGVSDAPE